MSTLNIVCLATTNYTQFLQDVKKKIIIAN